MPLSVWRNESRISMRARVTIVAAVFLVLLTLTLVSMWLVLQGRYLREEQLRRVLIATNLVSEFSQQPLAEGNILRLAYMADRTVGGGVISRVRIVDRTGTVIVDSDHDAYGTRPVVTWNAMQSKEPIIQSRPDYWLGASAVRNEEGQVLGAVLVEFPTAPLLSAQRSTQVVGLIVAFLGILAGSLIAYFAARIITRPLERLLTGIRQLRAGIAAEPVPRSGPPELVEMGTAFNEMATAVRERARILEVLNRMASDLLSAPDLHEVATTIRRSTADIMAARSYLWVVDSLSRRLIPVPAVGEQPVSEPVAANCGCLVGQAFAERRIMTMGEGTTDLGPGSEVTAGLVSPSAVVIPLDTQEGVAGVLAVTHPGRRTRITAEDRALAGAIGTIAAPVVMAQLRAQSQARATATLQSLLVPSELPSIGADLYAVYAPAEEMAGLGGDYYDIIPLEESKWGIIVGDASGKGLDAARQTTTAKFVIRSYVLEYGTPGEAMHWSNRALAVQTELERFITVFCGVLDTSTGNLVYASAGHLPPYLYSHATREVERCPVEGIALGVQEDASYSESCLKLESGDILCLYTDGITEARHGEEWFGDEKLAEVIRANAHQSSHELCDTIMQEVRAFADEGLKDDVVLLILKMP